MMSLRWGICGTGKIAHDFTAALNSLQFDVAFVGASSKEKAAEFAKLHNVLAHGTYVDLAESDSVDVVYIGTVHSAHKKHCLMMLNKNKAVLCEKPCTLNANDTKEVIAAARSNGVFFAEAMWTRYTPIVIEARKRLQRGDIGKIVMVQSDFGFRADTSNGGRLFDRALGGAAVVCATSASANRQMLLRFVVVDTIAWTWCDHVYCAPQMRTTLRCFGPEFLPLKHSTTVD
eukprot:m.172089 g.172089  ORF g.172089 m.172089 type:complete len:231 (+) comp18282_c0_seq56:176-868(+)